ncbi:unnamed protein product [Chrysodeixis includens]|uniref:Peptidase S1 domain-containing protein n=1 Tax=Chrysodeixis includens TaxID=689277 RepID=A0A9N8L4X6_CHRIL|nr:unnamed protein product [Chrysodeixis includens]
MYVDKVKTLFVILCSVSYVICELGLPEGASCYTEGVNGTCVELGKCTSANRINLFLTSGYPRSQFPELPDICSYTGKQPVVCCTDCGFAEKPYYNTALLPWGTYGSTKGTVAWKKCLDYFQRLPYICHGSGVTGVHKTWNKERQCHEISITRALSVGGRNAERWEFPHSALIGYGDDVETAEWLCGGTVISERFILTAAHCTAAGALGNVKFAALGLLKRTDPKKYWKIHNIKRIINHPEHKPPSKYHDIALLETNTEMNFGKDLLPACLDTGNKEINQAEASGWGRLGHRQALADTLQVVYLNQYNDSECASIYMPHRLLEHGYDPKTQMCYGVRSAVVDTCEGDSGGPLQVHQFKCLYTVVGITSYGRDCGIKGSAGMYTRVSYYVPWIESIVWPKEYEQLKSRI